MKYVVWQKSVARSNIKDKVQYKMTLLMEKMPEKNCLTLEGKSDLMVWLIVLNSRNYF